MPRKQRSAGWAALIDNLSTANGQDSRGQAIANARHDARWLASGWVLLQRLIPSRPDAVKRLIATKNDRPEPVNLGNLLPRRRYGCFGEGDYMDAAGTWVTIERD